MEGEKRCGQCESWDINGVDGKPVEPIVRRDSTNEKSGFCRINEGLVFGIRGESAICKQPEYFRPRKTIKAVNRYTQ